MGQYFLIANQNKQQFIDPFRLPVSEKIPALLNSDLIYSLLPYLIVGSQNRQYLKFKEAGFYTQKYLGAWYGDPVDLLGDYDEEELSRMVHSQFENISIEVAAIIFELKQDLMYQILDETKSGATVWLEMIRAIMELEHPPASLLFGLKELFGKSWKEELYRRLA
ncbi:hypothetical protein Pan153_28760 [Gimesia panareensis]|uniref:Uncharacterized protein n=1 Tax=Gimesia panareensis TaxID=2527978 RepID=A0A518FPE8_9PLAN|nr:hypothetical protein [Gimesia panareensis]QDV18219.1 hypothetical protein Pan153_28760 [Gimesia panareensis]